MSRYWEFNQRNVFSELLSLLGRITQENLTHQIEYLKVENEILRRRVGRSIRPTPGATQYPNQEWVNKQTMNVLPFLGSSKNEKSLFRDRDKKFSREFDELFKDFGFSVQKNPFMSPNMNSYAESWIGTIKRECLNHFVVFGKRHLRYLISEYVAHYNTSRPHSSMRNRPLEPRLAKNTGVIKCRTRLGGIIRNYYRG